MLKLFKSTLIFISQFTLLFLFISCKKDDSIKVEIIPVEIGSTNYSLGYEIGSTLGINIVDTNLYVPKDTVVLPEAIEIKMPQAGDQGVQNSCSAWATVYAAGSQWMYFKTGIYYRDSTNLSPRFTYNLITQGKCGGTAILDHLYILKTQGADNLGISPYDPNNCSQQPTDQEKSVAKSYKISGWKKLSPNNILLVQHALVEGYPVIFGIPVDNGLMQLKSPYVWQSYKTDIIGNHALVIVGYDNKKNAFQVMNSWGEKWGENGLFYISYGHLQSHAFSDAYIINK